VPVKLKKGDLTQYVQETCPILVETELIRKKWMLPLLLELFCSRTPLRFSDLQRKLNPITPKLLTLRLHDLEGYGAVTRVQKSVNDVEYSVTAKSGVLRELVGLLKRNCMTNSKAALARCTDCPEKDRCILAYGE